MISTILVGLLGLGVIIFVHELGHFSAAKLFGIEVEAFALGWGKKIWGVVKRGTEYRINIFPIGGYCKMKGEEDFKKALSDKSPSFPITSGSLFSVPAYKRLLTYAAGPIFNFLLAIFLLSLIWLIGFSHNTYSNKIILTSSYPEIFQESSTPNPADEAGMQNGDAIIQINDTEIHYFSDIQESIVLNPGEELTIHFSRNNQIYTEDITPALNKETGSGYLGITPFIEPVIMNIEENTSAYKSGIRSGDRITEVNGKTINNALDFYKIIQTKPGILQIHVTRNNSELVFSYNPTYDENAAYIPEFSFKAVNVYKQEKNIFKAVYKGTTDAYDTLILAFKSIGLLFKGVDTSSAMAGPVRITYLVGDVASKGFQNGLSQGIITLFNLISFISIALGFTNLLPIPALDGGQIIVSIYEIVRGKMLSPQKYYILQMIGFSIILMIFFFALFNDLNFLFRN
ncbi:MAG: RIP metalloprotease RseP [Spirochaetia bacterium]|nr:RIP metalloprotease RseP [Spirochaetia bacterium]